MADAIDKAVRAQGGFPVTPKQVRAMILAARAAYAEQSGLGLVGRGEGFDAWRRAALHDAVGAAADSFRAVAQRDFPAVMAYFGRLAGDTAEAPGGRGAEIKAADEARRARWALSRAEGETAGQFGGREGARRYADALFAKIHRTERAAATARQVWAVVFTLRDRAARIARKRP